MLFNFSIKVIIILKNLKVINNKQYVRCNIMSFCPKCGKSVEEGAAYCPNCGESLTNQPPRPMQPMPPPLSPVQPARMVGMKNEGLAAILSFFWPGLGQIYDGQIGRGIGILVGGIVLIVVAWILLWIPYIIYWAWNIYDAYNLAKKYNQELSRTGNPPW